MEASRLVATSAMLVATAHCFLSFGSGSSVHAQTLKAVKCQGKLPTGLDGFAILYDDRDDSIYLFGGGNSSAIYDDVIKYSISQDTIQIVGHLPSFDYVGGAVMNKFRNIFYLSGRLGKDIYQYFTDTRSFVNVSSLAEDNMYFATIRPDIDTALLIGGWVAPQSIISLNLNTLESRQEASLQENAMVPSAIWVEEQDAAYVFNSKTIQKYSRSGNRTERLSLQVPMQSGKYAVVWDGKFGYLLGTIAVEGNNPAQSLVQFDPLTETIAFIPVEDYVPVQHVTALYIQKLNRIYTFGGYIPDVGYLDEIHYINLDPLTQPPPPTTSTSTTEAPPIPSTMDPDIFNCLGRPNSNYPYPGDCTKFVICEEGHGYAFDCPEPLHFGPVNRHCTFPHVAGCE